MRIFVALLIGVVAFVGIGIGTGLISVPGITEIAPAKDKPFAEDMGPDLYTAEPYPALHPDAGKAKADPIILKGNAAIKDKQEVPSLVPGQVLYIGVAVPDSAVAVAGVAPFLVEPYTYNTITVGDDKIYKFYSRLLPSDTVQSDEVIGMVEYSAALEAIMEKQIKIEVARFDADSAKAAADEAASRYDRDKQLATRMPPAIAPAELSASFAAMKKFEADHRAKVKSIDVSKNELIQAKTLYAKHEIRNKVPYKRCVIQFIHKQRGDPVKDQDVVMTVHSLDHLQAEAMCDASYLDRFGGGQVELTATIEPSQEMRWKSPFWGAHRGEVTAVAVTNDERAPRVVSAGTDRVVNVRDPVKGGLPIRLPHPDVVRALVCSPVEAKHNLCLAGAGSSIYVWDLDRDALGDGARVEAVKIITEAHRSDGADGSRITCLAFSPNGEFFASGADDGSIIIWKTADYKMVYRLGARVGAEQVHSDPITALTFTRQCRLVSAATDKTVRIWHLQENGAVPEGEPIAGRDGNVPQLGVRTDGKWMLFDKGQSLQFLSLERPGATITTLHNTGAATPFETLALFSPNGSLLLTAGLPEGRLQLWKAPTETTRGFEVSQYVPKDKQYAATCAAFLPRADLDPKHRYVVSGNANGDVYFWDLPTDEQIRDSRIERVRVRLLSQSIDPNTHQARIAVDVPNPDGRLRPGKAVTVVIGEE